MRSIDAAQVAEELLQLFARVGVPDEILTDQGSTFTSKPTDKNLQVVTCTSDQDHTLPPTNRWVGREI